MNATNDMSAVIVPRSDQVNAEDYLSGPKSYTIESVSITPGTEQPVSIKLAGEDRVWKPCKSMSRVLVAAWGADASAYAGRSLTLFCDPKVKWGGMGVGGIRVSHMSHIERDMLLQLSVTKGKRAPTIIKPLLAEVAPIKAPAKQTPEQWVEAHKLAVAAATGLAELDAVIAKGKGAVAKLDRDHKDLRDAVMDAYSAKGEALEAAIANATPGVEPDVADEPDFGDEA